MYFAQALKTFRRDGYNKPELARALYKQARFMKMLEETVIGAGSPAHEIEKQAKVLYGILVPEYDGTKQLSESDFDSIVLFWSR